MAQVALRYTSVDLTTVTPSLRDEHARFRARHRANLVTFGPIRERDGTPAGYAYQTDFPGTAKDAMLGFLAEDPFALAGLYDTDFVSGWKCAFSRREAAQRPSLEGFFFLGVGKPGMTDRRNAIVDAHRAYLMQKDQEHCLARGPLTDEDGAAWLGSAMAYEFPDRETLDAFFGDEPYCVNGLYDRIAVYEWQRGAAA